MRILWLNWRDLRHPRAGGAEVYTHEVARRLVERGHAVTLFVGSAPGLSSTDELDGVRIVRGGGAVSTRFAARRWLRGHRHFDIVLEEINTIPYMARRWSGLPTLLLVHQIAREVWWWEAPWYVAPLGRVIEPALLRAVRGPAIALSQSTRNDLLSLGFDHDEVVVVPPGLSTSEAVVVSTTPVANDLFAYVGRLTPSKRVDHCIRAVGILRRDGLTAELAVVGRGPEDLVGRLKQLAAEEGVAEQVRFYDWLSDEERDRVVASASALVMASVREGWGMSVTEANALGIPAVVYRSPGLVDSTRAGETGLVVDPTPTGLASGMKQLMNSPDLRRRLSAGSRVWAAQLTWNATTDALEAALLRMATSKGAGPHGG